MVALIFNPHDELDGQIDLFFKHFAEFDSAVEAGKQPYMDFWYNNTWVSEAHGNGAGLSLTFFRHVGEQPRLGIRAPSMDSTVRQ